MAEVATASRMCIETKSLSEIKTISTQKRGFEIAVSSMRKMTAIMSPMV
jgi:hypothetical protein